MNIDTIGQLVEKNYGQKVKRLEELNERDGQYVLLAETTGGKLILRLCPPKRSQQQVLSDLGVLTLLNQAEFPVPQLHPTVNEQSLWEWQSGCWAYAVDYIEGEQPEIDLPTLNWLAQTLAQLHLFVGKPAEFPAQVNWLGELPLSIARAEAASTHPKWGKLAREVAATLKSLPDLSGLPIGLIHSDAHEGNLVQSPEGELYLVDWEQAGVDKMIFDVALVLGWLCVWPQESKSSLFGDAPDKYDFDEEYCTNFLTNYQQVRRLSEPEMNLLGPAIRFVLGWYTARDIEREIAEPGVSDGLAFTNYAILRSVTPAWERRLTKWAQESAH
jgi:Ser/Thr protein kinase RdoA (MazF antagonist)